MEREEDVLGGVMESPPVEALNLGSNRLWIHRRPGFGVVVSGSKRVNTPPTPYLEGVFADPAAREAFFRFVDQEGLVVARDLDVDPSPYRRVRGKWGRGRLSQGEFFHHDGCSSPTKPRILEIRCPPQDCVRSMGTSVALYPQNVETMLRMLPSSLVQAAELEQCHTALRRGELETFDWEALQGRLNRVLRSIEPESARAFFQDVDAEAIGWREPWALSESRFMANHNPEQTVQHRRACRSPWIPDTPNGGLIKRWPAEETPQPIEGAACLPCARSGWGGEGALS